MNDPGLRITTKRKMLNRLTLYPFSVRCLPVLWVLLLGFSTLAHSQQAEPGAAETTTPNEGEAQFKTVNKPQWEFGLAAAGVRAPAYPASGVNTERGFLVPWFIYRGDKVRFQDGGLKVIALQSQRVTIDVSISGSLNANSDDTPLRAGMPDLDYLLELGPKVDVRIWERDLGDGQKSRLNWSTALRLALSTDFSSIRSRGPVLGTQLGYRRSGLFGDTTSFSASVESTWTGEQLMDYFYAVDPAFVTSERPAFDAQAGYVGTRLSVGLGRRFHKNVLGFLGVAVALHDGATNDDSPLFESTSNTSVFGGISWTIKQSKGTIAVLEAN